MKKTLWCERERKSPMEIPTYYKVTASKVEEIEAGVQNRYRDEQGNEYIVRENKIKKRQEFLRIREA